MTYHFCRCGACGKTHIRVRSVFESWRWISIPCCCRKGLYVGEVIDAGKFVLWGLKEDFDMRTHWHEVNEEAHTT